MTKRLVLRALGAAAQMTGSTMIEFGCRSLSLLACLDPSTVAKVLRELCAEQDPYLVLLEGRRTAGLRLNGRRGLRGDLYQLRIPDEFALAAAWVRWRPGRIGVHPVFRILGGAAALICEQLTGPPVRTADLPVLTGLASSTISVALADLAVHALAARGPGGWQRGPAVLDEVAGQLGVPQLLADLQARYSAQRRDWLGWLAERLLKPRQPAEPPEADVPWPEAPTVDEHGELLAARAPPATPITADDPRPGLAVAAAG